MASTGLPVTQFVCTQGGGAKYFTPGRGTIKCPRGRDWLCIAPPSAAPSNRWWPGLVAGHQRNRRPPHQGNYLTDAGAERLRGGQLWIRARSGSHRFRSNAPPILRALSAVVAMSWREVPPMSDVPLQPTTIPSPATLDLLRPSLKSWTGPALVALPVRAAATSPLRRRRAQTLGRCPCRLKIAPLSVMPGLIPIHARREWRPGLDLRLITHRVILFVSRVAWADTRSVVSPIWTTTIFGKILDILVWFTDSAELGRRRSLGKFNNVCNCDQRSDIGFLKPPACLWRVEKRGGVRRAKQDTDGPWH